LKPVKINGFNNEKILSIACGGGHSLALTDSGKVYGWGWNNYGQVGSGKYYSQYIPEIISPNNNQKFKSISCGYQHSLLLTNEGDIYAFGSNYFGQIGNGQSKTKQMTPLKINQNLKFKEIACYHSAYISVAKGIDDYCYVWGHCQNGSFSLPNKTERKSLEEIFAKYSVIKVTFKAVHLNKCRYCEILANNRLLENISKLFNDPKYSDLVFKIDDKKIFVHKLILRTNCNYFESKFDESSRAIRESAENKRNYDEIQITEYSYDIYYAFLKYIYTDSVDIESEKAMNLLVLANDYKEEKLKEKCFDIIKSDITIENVCSLYCISIKLNLQEFEKFCFNYSVNKMNHIFKTKAFREMDEKSMKKFMERAAEYNVFKK
jgi:RCC1 and BTB domain-containing protein